MEYTKFFGCRSHSFENGELETFLLLGRRGEIEICVSDHSYDSNITEDYIDNIELNKHKRLNELSKLRREEKRREEKRREKKRREKKRRETRK